MLIPNTEIINKIKKEFPQGTRVELISMNDPHNSKLTSGCKGTVTEVDDIGTIHVNWDCGFTLGIIYGVDKCKKLQVVTTICYGITKNWDSRTDAIEYFFNAMLYCEGSEKERYTNIYLKLIVGNSVCDDSSL